MILQLKRFTSDWVLWMDNWRFDVNVADELSQQTSKGGDMRSQENATTNRFTPKYMKTIRGCLNMDCFKHPSLCDVDK